jgi:hypothetical protein
MNRFFNLPREIQAKIYEYDSTYLKKYSQCVDWSLQYITCEMRAVEMDWIPKGQRIPMKHQFVMDRSICRRLDEEVIPVHRKCDWEQVGDQVLNVYFTLFFDRMFFYCASCNQTMCRASKRKHLKTKKHLLSLR